jgi:hypothetical protein
MCNNNSIQFNSVYLHANLTNNNNNNNKSSFVKYIQTELKLTIVINYLLSFIMWGLRIDIIIISAYRLVLGL